MASIQPSISELAALVGNPARTSIQMALMDGRAHTATELACSAGVSPQTTSGHLAKMAAAHLLVPAKQGRHSYFRLASPGVARMLEGIMVVANDDPSRRLPRWHGDEQLRTARTCYDHLAGRLGVALADALIRRKHLELSEDGGVITPAGAKFLSGFGVDEENARRSRRVFCRPCLDWSERRPHLAGALGAALATRCFDLKWIVRKPDSRALDISTDGQRGFAETFGVSRDAE
jgi:DNA-binding transcriptional ArsR family regulator